MESDADSITGNFHFTGEGQSWTEIRNASSGRSNKLVRTELQPDSELHLCQMLRLIAAAGAPPGFRWRGCHKQPQAQDQNMSLDSGVPSNEVLANADIETLPADESSATPSNQLQNGFDNPDVNDVGNASNSE